MTDRCSVCGDKVEFCEADHLSKDGMRQEKVLLNPKKFYCVLEPEGLFSLHFHTKAEAIRQLPAIRKAKMNQSKM